MTALDIGIVVFALAMAVLGYQQGLIVGGITLGGFAVGAFAGSRFGPELLQGGSESPYAPLTALLGAVLLGGMLAVVAEGLAHAVRVQLIRGRALGALDGAGGAVLLGALALALAWLFGAVALNTPGLTEVRTLVQRSQILARLNETLPPTGPALNVLNRVDPRQILEGPDPRVAAPDAAIARDPEVRQAGEAVVRVLGTACGLGISGSGWVAASGTVVTNAHVVAGEEDTTVQTMAGTELDAAVVRYEPRNDLAVLRVEGLDAPALSLLSTPEAGVEAAVLGYPENGPFTIAAARLGQTGALLSQDSYGRGPIRREMTSFRGEVRSGNSGGPVVDSAGRVLTTVFAASTDQGPASGLGVPNEIVSRALGRLGGPVDPGPCAA